MRRNAPTARPRRSRTSSVERERDHRLSRVIQEPGRHGRALHVRPPGWGDAVRAPAAGLRMPYAESNLHGWRIGPRSIQRSRMCYGLASLDGRQCDQAVAGNGVQASHDQGESVMRKLVVTVAALILFAVPAYAAGQGAQTETIHFADTETFEAGPDCVLPEGTVGFIDFEAVMHTTTLANGQIHTHGTFVGDLTLTLPGGKVYTGHFADRSGSNLNNRNEAGGFGSNNVVKAADGSRLHLHLLDHFNLDANGEPHFFFQLNCGGGDVTPALSTGWCGASGAGT